MTKSSLEDITRRLEDLEREKRQVLRVSGILFVGMLALLAGMLAYLRRGGTIEARNIVLRDDAGRVRARWGLNPDGSPTLALLDRKGNELVTLQSTADDSAALYLHERGRVAVALTADSQGSTRLGMYDRFGRGAAGLYVWPDSTAGLGLSNLGRSVDLAAQPDGLTGLGVTDAQGQLQAKVGTLPEDTHFHALPGTPRRDAANHATLSGQPVVHEVGSLALPALLTPAFPQTQ